MSAIMRGLTTPGSEFIPMSIPMKIEWNIIPASSMIAETLLSANCAAISSLFSVTFSPPSSARSVTSWLWLNASWGSLLSPYFLHMYISFVIGPKICRQDVEKSHPILLESLLLLRMSSITKFAAAASRVLWIVTEPPLVVLHFYMTT